MATTTPRKKAASSSKAFNPTEVLRRGYLYQQQSPSKPELVPPSRALLEFVIYRDAETPPQVDPLKVRSVEYRVTNLLTDKVFDQGAAKDVGSAVQAIEDNARRFGLLVDPEAPS